MVKISHEAGLLTLYAGNVIEDARINEKLLPTGRCSWPFTNHGIE